MDTIRILETIRDGAIGGLTFGMYHYYISMKMLQSHNEKIELQRQKYIEAHAKDINELHAMLRQRNVGLKQSQQQTRLFEVYSNM